MNFVYHRSALVTEVLDILRAGPKRRFIDATVGDAGHTIAIAKKGGIVLGVDWDQEAIERSKRRIQKEQLEDQILLVKGNFAELEKIASRYGFTSVSGILFDLGASTHQLTNARRGFSIYRKGSLDMRMDRSRQLRASNIVNTASEEELYEIFTKYSQEHHSRAIARAIVRTRSLKGKIASTDELVEVVKNVLRFKNRKRIHPATRVFQALRIAVNKEIENLRLALPQAVNLLIPGGRLSVISFHSAEDRIVKQFFQRERNMKVITKRPIKPSPDETRKNKRVRSARLRVGERI